jgi:hypothetical protein
LFGAAPGTPSDAAPRSAPAVAPPVVAPPVIAEPDGGPVRRFFAAVRRFFGRRA